MLFSLTVFSFWSESIEMPEMPSVPSTTSVDMPEMPALSNGFYKPNVPSMTNATSNKKTGNEKNKTDNSPTLSSGRTSNDLISSLLSGNASLSADDISSLYDYGMFDNISSLSGVNLYSGNQNYTTEILLKQILASLEELKKENKNRTLWEKESLEDVQQDSRNFKNRSPAILRFKINGYNLSDSLTTVFFSKPETDGSFLLTCDRTYYINQKVRSETFYILFKAVKSNGSTTTYEVTPSIVQDYKNENSFVYQMAQRKDLTAQKTGNLVVLNYTKGGWSLDMLLDIDSNKE